jgi:ABC-2 type transport system ATP-binding protein
MSYAIECERVGRVYRSNGGETAALTDLDLQVPAGMVFGLLGPNGAGKTTTVRILATLLSPTSGSARVLGFDVAREPQRVRAQIGLILGGDRGLYGQLSGLENLRYFGALNHLDPRHARLRSIDLLEQVGLSDVSNRRVEEYSRGMKQRLHIARGLLSDPAVIFMDEPTIGLDPIGAQEIRDYIPQLVAQGKTILLTTHYMLEADLLCGQLALIDHGRLVAHGTPTEIKQKFSRVSIVEVFLRELRIASTDDLLEIEGVRRVFTISDGPVLKLVIHVQDGTDPHEAIRQILGEDAIETMAIRPPTLEEAYTSILQAPEAPLPSA